MAEQEDLDDLLADVPDLSVREAEEALRAAGKSGSLEEIVAVLEEADEALKELQTDVKAMRRRNDKARGMDAAMRKARAAADKQAAKAAKPARSVRREDTLVAFIAEASALSVAAAENELVAAESADTMVELDQHLGRAEVELAALLAIIKAPALPSDAGLSISPNGIIERRIVWNLLTKLSLAGFVVECVDDGGDLIECDGDAMKAIKVGDVIDWSCTPDHALVLVQDGEDIRDWYFRHGDHGWWVGGEPTLLGKAEFIPSISPLGNGWPEWSGWHFERCTVVALNLRGDETGEELLALAGGPT